MRPDVVRTVRAKAITRPGYRPYGDVIEPFGEARSANMGTASVYDRLAKLENKRPDATPNLSIFRCQPHRGPVFHAALLEKHPASTQVFLPLLGSDRYLVIVALGAAKPDLSTLRAFVAPKGTGISYFPGVWHHPMVALDKLTDFACLVWEDGTPVDCRVERLAAPVAIHIGK